MFLAGNNVPGVAGALLLEFGQKLQHPFASVSEEGHAGRNAKQAPNAQTCEAPPFPGLENILEMSWLQLLQKPNRADIRALCRTGREEAYELVRLQPSMPSCLYQYFLMPSQGMEGGSFQGSEGDSKLLVQLTIAGSGLSV